MILGELGLNRFLYKDPRQTNQTESPIFTASNPAPKTGSGNSSGGDQNRGNEKDDGSKNILTGTVITSCFIQTTALPSRIELAGNDLTFYDNTFTQDGVVKGDTSRLVFTHDLDSGEGFIMEKRASVYDTYDNVLSWYATPAKDGRQNYMFIGRNAYAGDQNRNVNFIDFAINRDTTFAPTDPDQETLNGIFRIEYSEDGVQATGAVPFQIGSSDIITGGILPNGFSSVMIAGQGGISGIGYRQSGSPFGTLILLYCLNETSISIGADMIPDANGAYDIGAPGAKIGTFYGSVVACPLPTVENPIAVLEKILPPTEVGDRGHFGERKYYDDLTFPEELLHTTPKGHVEIEHTRMIGFLLQTVIELNAQVKELKARLPE